MNCERAPFFPLTVVRFLIGYGTYFGGNFLFILLATPVLLVLTPFPRAQYALLHFIVHDYLAFFTRVWLPALGIYRVAESAPPAAAGPVIYVANHRGFMDAPLLLGLLPGTGVLIKTRYTRWMVPGLLARHFDLVSLDPNSAASVVAAVSQCRALIAAGKSLLVFPEGTRARSGRLGYFKSVAFRIALESGAPVVPVVMHSTQPFMAKLPGSLFPRHRNVYRIRFLDAELPVADDAADALADRVYRRMARALKELDKGTVWATL